MTSNPVCQQRLGAIAIVWALALFTSWANAGEADWRHGDALFGELRYGPDFSHYEHVNPDAPKAGTYHQAVHGGYDSFNPFVVRGRPAAGLTSFGGILYDNLLEQSVDQPSASYGLVADAFRAADDHSWAVYRIHPKARWHDGEPITAEDVIWSMEVLRANYPLWKDYYKNIETVSALSEREIEFRFDQAGNRELPHIIGDLPVLPKHWWTGIGADGNPRDISKPTTEPPLGSGPYRIGEFDLGKSITWDRVEDYWGADLPVRKGRFNFDHLKYTYFLDQTAIWEAFKKGGISDLRVENRSQRWAQGYDFPAYERGDVVRKAFPGEGGEPFQGYYFNIRLEKFADRRVRQALGLLFDFESMNKTLFFGAYRRTDSFFEGGELQSSGVPQGRELEILEEYRDQLPPELFTQPFELPVFEKPGDFRSAQRTAIRLFREAGFNFAGGKMLGPDGEQFSIEFLGDSPVDERIAIPYIENLRKLGIEANLRVVDTAQYGNRVDEHDFEVTSVLTLQSQSPGNEQREYWSSSAADTHGSRNYAGIKDPVVDELVERIIVAPNRQEQVHLVHALDRVLKWGFYVVPHWHNPDDWIAYWRQLQIPEPQPTLVGVDLFSFWIDEAVERELEAGR